MTAGFWYNNDGIPVQYGTQKAIPELGGEYLSYGDVREVEAYIALAPFFSGATTTPQQIGPSVPGLPSSFVGTGTPIQAGIQTMTTLLPLQQTAPVTVGASGNGLVLSNPQLWVDMIELEVLVSANAGTGGATGLTSCTLVTTQPQTSPANPSQFVQVTPSVGYTIFGSILNANLTAGKRWTWYPDGTVLGSSSPPTAGSFLGNIPQVSNTISPLPTSAWISTTASGGTFSGTTAAGLLKLRIKYYFYGNISY